MPMKEKRNIMKYPWRVLINIWLLVWNMLYVSIRLQLLIPADELIFFRGRGISPSIEYNHQAVCQQKSTSIVHQTIAEYNHQYNRENIHCMYNCSNIHYPLANFNITCIKAWHWILWILTPLPRQTLRRPCGALRAWVRWRQLRGSRSWGCWHPCEAGFGRRALWKHVPKWWTIGISRWFDGEMMGFHQKKSKELGSIIGFRYGIVMPP